MSDQNEVSRDDYAQVALLFGLRADFYLSQDWGEFADPERVAEFVDAYEQSKHRSVWIDKDLTGLIWDSYARQWLRYERVEPAAQSAVERFIARWHKRLAVRSYLHAMAGLEGGPGDEYPECDWLRQKWTTLTGEPLQALLAFDLMAVIGDPRARNELGPPQIPE